MQREPPGGWVELLTRQDWERVSKLGGFVVISDDATDRAEGGPKYHHRGCRSVALASFTEKVLDGISHGQRPNGRYFWVASERVARDGARAHASSPTTRCIAEPAARDARAAVGRVAPARQLRLLPRSLFCACQAATAPGSACKPARSTPVPPGKGTPGEVGHRVSGTPG